MIIYSSNLATNIIIELVDATAPQPAGIGGTGWKNLTGSTGQANLGLMFWDGSNVRVYTGNTQPYYAKVTFTVE